MTREKLAEFDGREGRKAYVAVNGNIYDFTGSNLWQDGAHQAAHQAGRDLTDELKSAPHVRAVIERFPVIDKLEETAPEPEKKSGKGLLIGIAVTIIAVVIIALIM